MKTNNSIRCNKRLDLDTFGMEPGRPYNKGKLNEPLMYLDRRTVTKLAPAECSESYLNRVVLLKKELYGPARKAVERIVRPLKPAM